MLDVEPFSVRLAHPLETADRTIRERSGFLVFVDYQGTRGVGEATPLPGWTESLGECRDALVRAAEIAEELDWGVALAKTEAPAARHGLSLALAEARARTAGRQLYRHLGEDRVVPSVPVNATIGDADPEATAREAGRATSEGFGCLKVKVGARPVEDDATRLRAVRERVGESVELRADANGAWNPDRAEDAFEAFADLGVSYVEQPLDPGDLTGHRALRGRAVDVALDESLREFTIDEIVDAGAADVVIVKPMVLGGPDLARAAATAARAAGIDPVVSTTVDAVVARTGAVHVAASLPEIRPCGLATGALLASDLSEDPAPVVDGSVELSQEKGLGLLDRLAR
jgi:o-succinylbenzoate synthase